MNEMLLGGKWSGLQGAGSVFRWSRKLQAAKGRKTTQVRVLPDFFASLGGDRDQLYNEPLCSQICGN